MIPKFRFWYEREDFYPDENFMSNVWQIEYVTDSIIYLNDSFTFNPYTNVAGSSYAKAKIYLMQSTGLKDKNGIEIYEGDIVKVTQYLGGMARGRLIHLVEKSKYNNNLMLIRKSKRSFLPEVSLRFNRSKDYEVIGNIYENPELLEEIE